MAADEEQFQGIPEFSFGDKEAVGSGVHSQKSVVEHVLDMEKLTSIDYSWSTYFKHSWKSPSVMRLEEARYNWLNMAGITKADRDITKASRLEDRVLALFMWPLQQLTGYQLCTYNQDNNIPNDCQNVESGFDEYELGWTWFYMGYSSRRQKAYAVIYFALSNKYFELSWPGRQHLKKPSALKFQLGANADFNANGRFFDVRVDYGPGSYFGNLEDVQAYIG